MRCLEPEVSVLFDCSVVNTQIAKMIRHVTFGSSPDGFLHFDFSEVGYITVDRSKVSSN